MLSFRLTIPAEARHASLAGTLLKTFCEQAGLSPADAARIELAAVEGVNNAIEHAYQGQAGGAVAIEAGFGEDGLRVEVRDQGASLAAPPSTDMPDPWAEHGRGWPIMLACVDRVDYHRDGGTNVLTLFKHLPVSA